MSVVLLLFLLVVRGRLILLLLLAKIVDIWFLIVVILVVVRATAIDPDDDDADVIVEDDTAAKVVLIIFRIIRRAWRTNGIVIESINRKDVSIPIEDTMQMGPNNFWYGTMTYFCIDAVSRQHSNRIKWSRGLWATIFGYW